ncbi:MAG: hypothetical protein JRF61_17475 [Deltaproteobacteria bacterium]|jgi:hypothetical protein|nr:hypothetical protein [Deltaproteobacteria bacterium]
MRIHRQPVLLGLMLTAAALAPVVANALPGSETPTYDVPTESCFWGPAVGSGQDGLWNYVYPDSNAVYQCSSFDLPDGAELIFEAEYPRSRHMSWTLYGGLGGDQLIDTQIEPDPGSTNPFINGTFRRGQRRSYTMRALKEDPPADPADRDPNTLYAGPPTPGPFGNFLCVRIYVPDKGTEPFGDVKLPEVTLVQADGSALEGEALCEATDALNRGFAVPPQAAGFDRETYLFLRQAGLSVGPSPMPTPPTHPAADPPDFKAFFNRDHQQCSFFTPQLDCGTPVLDPDGAGLGNPSNRYIETYIDRGFGEVLVLRAKKPTTPRTFRGNPLVPDRDYELRYYSICPQESLFTWRVGDCLFDEELPTDEDGFYTVVLSKPSFRPKNATRKCGVAWAPTPDPGDGAGDLFLSNIWIRFMLPSPNFAEAAQNILIAGTEEEVMGDFYPRGDYMSKAEFEARGCRLPHHGDD